MFRILIYGKDKLTLNTLADLLTSLPDTSEVYCSSDEKEVLQRLNGYDVIITDEDAEIFKKICKQTENLSLLLTDDTELSGKQFIQKPIKFDDFVNILCRLLLEHNRNAEQSIKIKNAEFFPTQRTLLCSDKKHKIFLTEKEAEILMYLWRSKPSAVDKNELLREVWGYGTDITTHTLQTHIYRLRLKTEKHGLELIRSTDGGYALCL